MALLSSGAAILFQFGLFLIVGVMLYLASSAFYATGIKHGQLSVLFPMVAIGYVWTLVWSRLFFREEFTRVFRGQPAGRLEIQTMSTLIARIRELERRVERLSEIVGDGAGGGVVSPELADQENP